MKKADKSDWKEIGRGKRLSYDWKDDSEEKIENGMSFDEALEILDIVEFKNDIFNSNSHGELFHLIDYIALASFFKEYELVNEDEEGKEVVVMFKEWFAQVVEYAKKNHKRPESIYQHILPLFQTALNKL